MKSGTFCGNIRKCNAAFLFAWSNSGCFEHWFEFHCHPVTLPTYLPTLVAPRLQFLLGDCSYARAPGRPTRESFCTKEKQQERREKGKNDGGGGGGLGQNRPSCWLIYPPSYPFPLFLQLVSCFFYEHACCRTNGHEVTQCHTCTQTHKDTGSILPCFCVLWPSLWQANKDPLFLTGVTFPSEYPASPETLVKLTVYDAKNKNQESVSKQLLCLCISV